LQNTGNIGETDTRIGFHLDDDTGKVTFVDNW